MSGTVMDCERCGKRLTMGDPDTCCAACENDRAVWVRRPSLLAWLLALLGWKGRK